MVWVCLKIEKWVTRSDPEFFPYKVITDLSEVNNVTFRENGFNIAVGLYDFKGKFLDIEPEFGKF